MTKKKNPTHQVVKAGCYFTPGKGELKVGSQMTLSTAQAKKLEERGFVKSLEDVETVDVSGAVSKELEKVKAQLATVTRELDHTKIELDGLKKGDGKPSK